MDLSYSLLQFMTGLAYASSLFLLSVGLSLIFGALGIINFAHGSFYMLGAYLLYAFTRGNADAFWIATPLVFLAGLLIGAVVEIVLLRPIYRQPEHYQLLLTYALVLIIEDTVKVLYGAGFKSIGMPPGFQNPVFILDLAFPSYYLGLMGLSAATAFLLWLFLKRTRYGLLVRAVTQDREMLSALGVNVPRLFTLVFALGIALAALGGAASFPLQSISPGIALNAVIDAFIVVVVGGLGSIWGALLGAVLIGEFRAFGVVWLPELSIVFVYLLMALVLLFRPWGLLGRPPAVRT